MADRCTPISSNEMASFVAPLIPHHSADADPARLGERLKARGNITPSPKMSCSSALTSPRLMPMRNSIRFFRYSRITLSHPSLHFDRAAHRVDHAGEFGKEAIAGFIDDAAAMLGDLLLDQLSQVRLEPRMRTLLIREWSSQKFGAQELGRRPPDDFVFITDEGKPARTLGPPIRPRQTRLSTNNLYSPRTAADHHRVQATASHRAMTMAVQFPPTAAPFSCSNKGIADCQMFPK
jgi:hypothetical protein